MDKLKDSKRPNTFAERIEASKYTPNTGTDRMQFIQNQHKYNLGTEMNDFHFIDGMNPKLYKLLKERQKFMENRYGGVHSSNGCNSCGIVGNNSNKK